VLTVLTLDFELYIHIQTAKSQDFMLFHSFSFSLLLGTWKCRLTCPTMLTLGKRPWRWKKSQSERSRRVMRKIRRN